MTPSKLYNICLKINFLVSSTVFEIFPDKTDTLYNWNMAFVIRDTKTKTNVKHFKCILINVGNDLQKKRSWRVSEWRGHIYV